MRLIIASDIHGSAYYCEKLIEQYNKIKPDKLVLLGDLLYHGPRNELPRDYSPKTVAQLLNSVSDSIICVRGNCDSEVDQMLLDFPIMAEYCLLYDGTACFFATHGHVYNPDNMPKLSKGDILINGHTHVPAIEKQEHFTYINPGSVSIPKNGSRNQYLYYESGVFTQKYL